MYYISRTSLDIYTSDADMLFFSAPYNAKRLLHDSVTRTIDGYDSICKGKVLTGCANILLARIESIAAWAFVALSAIFFSPCIVLTSCFLIPTTILNLASRLPGISSFETMQNFTKESNALIMRIFKVSLIALPIIFLFLTASGVSTFLPGILKEENIFFDGIHQLVEPLGKLKTICAVVPEKAQIVGLTEELSWLEAEEEYFRAFSHKNYLSEVVVDDLHIHHTYHKTN